MKRLLPVVVLTVLVLTASGLMLAQNNPLLGTWKLNPAKSKYVNTPAPKSETRTVVAQGDGVKVTQEGVAGDGSRIAFSYTTNYDGKDSPITGAYFNGADTIAVKRVSANTTTSTAKKAGKPVQMVTTVVSSDGKVGTMTTKGTNEKGQPTSSTVVWDKQ